MKIKLINGPNINLLGIREKDIYGDRDYSYVVDLIENWAKENDVKVDIVQSNYEGKIIDEIQDSYFSKYDGILINPGGYSHTSISIRDGISSVNLPCVEVHISNIYEREDFRKTSLISDVSIKTIVGKGLDGYIEGLDYLKAYILEYI